MYNKILDMLCSRVIRIVNNKYSRLNSTCILWFRLLLSILALLSTLNNAFGLESPLNYLKVYTDSNGKKVLFLRKKPIVALSIGFDEAIAAEFSAIVSLFSYASSIPVSFSNKDPNIIIIKTEDIAIGDRLNLFALRKFNMPEKIVSMMAETTGWSSGCAWYVFGNNDGRIVSAVGLVDKRLDSSADKACVVAFVTQAFGIGLDRKIVMPGVDERFKNAYLLNIVQICDSNYLEISEIKNCIVSRSQSLNFAQ